MRHPERQNAQSFKITTSQTVQLCAIKAEE